MTPNELRKRIQSLQTTLDQINTQLKSISEQSKSTDRERTPYRPEFIPISDSEVKLPPSISTYYNAENNERKAKTIWKRIEVGIALGGLVAVVAYVVVTCFTLSALKRQADESVRQFKLDQRPWITTRDVALSTEIGVGVPGNVKQAISIDFSLDNSGKTPALDVFPQVAQILYPYSAPFVSNMPSWFRLFKNPQMSEMAGFSVIRANSTTKRLRLPFFAIPQMSGWVTYRTGQSTALFFIADIRYRDSFGITHRTTSCAFHIANTPLDYFQACPGNSMDNGY